MSTPRPEAVKSNAQPARDRGDDDQSALVALFESHYEAVMNYARRRTENLADAEEIAAQTFVVAWRRLDESPAPHERLYWLYGIARRVLANHRRGVARRLRLHAKLRAVAPAPVDGSSRLPDVLRAMDRLSDTDQEILRLAAWEDLSPAEIGSTLGISANAAAIRLHRARARLKVGLDDDASASLKGLRRIRTFVGWKGSDSRRSRQEEAR